jgi:hypothetical protein
MSPITGNFNAMYNNVTAPNFGQFVGFLDRRETGQ